MKIQLATKPLSEIKSDLLVLPVFENEADTALPFPIVKDFLKDNPKFGKLLESQLLYSKEQTLLLLGTGKRDKFNFEKLQNWAGTAVKQNLKKVKQLSILLPLVEGLTEEQHTEAVVIGAEIATHDLGMEFKTEKEPNTLTSLEIIIQRANRGFNEGIRVGAIKAEAINLVRRLGDLPANIMTPTYFLTEVKRLAKETKLKLTVLNEIQAKRKGMGAFVGVAQGSEEPSYMIALEYIGNLRSKDKWGVVGKGITFDTGGISIKPSSAMGEMKYDMCGAATALATIVAIAKLKLPVNVVSVMAVTENLPGGKAQRPGDIVTTYSGKTAEVIDTDAEGRLVLIDAVAYAQKDFKANKVIDLATLTGAIIIALGDYITGAFSNDPDFVNQIIKVGAEVGEKYWEMPMDEEFDEMIKGDFADIANLGHGGSHRSAAGSTTGAKFIQAGIKEGTPWIHLDIAGTAWDMKPKPYRGVGATGVGVKTLVKLIEG